MAISYSIKKILPIVVVACLVFIGLTIILVEQNRNTTSDEDHTVTLFKDGDGGQLWYQMDADNVIYVDSGASLNISTDQSLTVGVNLNAGWRIVRWSDESGTVEGNTIHFSSIQSSLDLTVFMERIESVVIIEFNANGGNGTMTGIAGSEGSPIILPENGFTNSGYTFVEWNTSADGTGTGYTPGETFTMPSGTTTLYAVWTANPDGTLIFNSNEGQGTMADVIHPEGFIFDLPTNGFTRAGYVFAGWNTSADGSGDSFSDEASFTMPSGTTTLYAVWTDTTT